MGTLPSKSKIETTERIAAFVQIRNTLILLRFPFSFFLLPVSLYALIFLRPHLNFDLILSLFIWHLLVFPSSNGYNSYHDRDKGPIGGLKAPPEAGRYLLYATNGMDLLAVIAAMMINTSFVCFVLLYIIFSRLYSHRSVRLKQYPFLSFFVVTFFQGAWIFSSCFFAAGREEFLFSSSLQCAAIASTLFVASVYPLTQIYQHEQDKADGVTTISMRLGIPGTFIFSAMIFMLAGLFVYLSFPVYANLLFMLFSIFMFPVITFFSYWVIKSIKNKPAVDFRNTMTMLVLSSLMNNSFFVTLLIL